MEISYLKIIQSLVVVGFYILIKIVSNKLISKTMSIQFIQKSRGAIVRKAINVTLLIICMSLILIIWGVNQSEIAAYTGSILTVVGVAFFAQWSILSNITSSVIIFFNHSVKIDDRIIILEGKDHEIEGRVSNIGLFFINLKTMDNEDITLPNNIFIQKTIKKVN